jgi:hypothetical protein
MGKGHDKMLGFIIATIFLLLFVLGVILLLAHAVRTDTLDYDMKYVWNDYDITLDDINMNKVKRKN